MKGIIDRFEENIAVVELDDKTILNIQKSKLPINIKEGDFVILNNNKISIDIETTKRKKQELDKLMDKLFE